MLHQLITPSCELIPPPTLKQQQDYHIISIFGSQSTGKSTLLNLLFDTEFSTMTSRSRTTRGIILSQSNINTECNLIVLDVEGTDGREHGEDNSFERKSALFTLSVSSVIIMNIFENMVGLYNGANLGLLRTVLDVNREISQSGTKTLLLFVIRDYAGVSTEEELSRVIRESLEEIWNSLSATAATLYDYFDISIFTLPHKILQPNEFSERVGELRKIFSNGNNSEYLNIKYHKNIPIDGLSLYTQSIWNTINANKSLDIPTQQSLLAQYRLDEIINELVKKAADDAAQSTEMLVAEFDKRASRYNAVVYQRKRVEFMDRVRVVMRDRFMAAYKRVYNDTVEEYKRELMEMLESDNLDGIVELDRRVESEFTAAITAINDDEFEFDALSLTAIKQPLTQDRVFRLKDEFMSRVKREILRLVEDRLASAAVVEYPSDLIRDESAKLNYIITTLLGHAKIEVDLREWFSGTLKDCINESLVRRWFDTEFKYTSDRRLVEYGSMEEMSVRWRECLGCVEERLDGIASTAEGIISHDKLVSLKDSLRVYAEQCYSEYKRQRESGAIPPYVYVLLLVLGFNEIMFIVSMLVSSPVTTLFMVVVGVGVGVIVRNRDNQIVRMVFRMDVVRDVFGGVVQVGKPIVVGLLDGLREMIEEKRKVE